METFLLTEFRFNSFSTVIQNEEFAVCGTLVRLASDTCTAHERHLHGSRATLAFHTSRTSVL